MTAFPVPVVAVPARNEEALLPGLVAALARQTIIPRLKAPLRVVIVLNNTDDESQRVVHEAASHAPDLHLTLADVKFPPEHTHVGSARRMAMDMAVHEGPCDVVLTTDADAVPADDWVEMNLHALRAGADIVGGHLFAEPLEEERLGRGFLFRARTHAKYGALRDELAFLLDPLRHDPWPRHHDHTGASIAVRADVYGAVGGMDPLPFREDLAFVSKVRAAGFRLRHPLDVAVTVSARISGRARGGMADWRQNWVQEEAEGKPLLLECPGAIEKRLRRRRSIRDLDGMKLPAVRRRLRQWGLIPYAESASIAPLSIASLIERFAADDPDAVGTVPAEIAIAALERRIVALREPLHAA